MCLRTVRIRGNFYIYQSGSQVKALRRHPGTLFSNSNFQSPEAETFSFALRCVPCKLGVCHQPTTTNVTLATVHCWRTSFFDLSIKRSLIIRSRDSCTHPKTPKIIPNSLRGEHGTTGKEGS
ncbi:hypothetical protein LZ554_000835 [Drepanopeziza brunnea f. sp. 'monogermtubi']|nr:hypothetical protein LZ554_000835 [Drepanopeziza brunnea f. sp. 'monogermtubi']